jgi:hypothetical protein
MSCPVRRFAHVFEGDGFGVGLTVYQLDTPGLAPDQALVASGQRPVRPAEMMPVTARGPAGLGLEMRLANVADAQLWAARPTATTSAACGRHHHRLKTHAPGWAFSLDSDGNYLVTTPSGVTRISRPPGSYLLEPYEFGVPLPDTLIIDVPPF